MRNKYAEQSDGPDGECQPTSMRRTHSYACTVHFFDSKYACTVRFTDSESACTAHLSASTHHERGEQAEQKQRVEAEHAAQLAEQQAEIN